MSGQAKRNSDQFAGIRVSHYNTATTDNVISFTGRPLRDNLQGDVLDDEEYTKKDDHPSPETVSLPVKNLSKQQISELVRVAQAVDDNPELLAVIVRAAQQSLETHVGRLHAQQRAGANQDQNKMPKKWDITQRPREVQNFLEDEYVPIFGTTISRSFIRDYDKNFDAAVTNYLKAHGNPKGITLVGIREEKKQARNKLLQMPRSDLPEDALEMLRAFTGNRLQVPRSDLPDDVLEMLRAFQAEQKRRHREKTGNLR